MTSGHLSEASAYNRKSVCAAVERVDLNALSTSWG